MWQKKNNTLDFYNIIKSKTNTENIKQKNPKSKTFQVLQELKTIKSEYEDDINVEEEEKNYVKNYMPKIMNQFINNVIALICEIGINNYTDNKFLYYVLYKFSIISSKTREYLIKVIPVLDYINNILNLNLTTTNNGGEANNTKENISIKKYYDYSFNHDILNINNVNGKIKIINDKGGLYHYENYLYLLYFSILTDENCDKYSIFSFDKTEFIFKLFTELINRQDCYLLAHLLNIKCYNNISREKLVINLIGDILDKLDYKEDINYKLNKSTFNTHITSIKEYKNKYELDPRNILLTFKLFMLYKDKNGNTNKNRIKVSVQKIFELIKKYSKYYNYCILMIDFIIDLFLYNKIMREEYVKQFMNELEYIKKWIKERPISPKLYKIEGLFMYRDDNVNYQDNINEQQKKEFNEKEIEISNKKIKLLDNIIKNKVNKNEYSIDSDLINISEFLFAKNDQIIYNGRNAVVTVHLNETIKIKFENNININEIKNGKELNNIDDDKNNEEENKVISKMWVDIEDEKIKIKKLYIKEK